MLEGNGYASQRAEMVEKQLRRRGISDSAVLAAMLAVPRHEFVPEELRSRAYEDAPLPIGGGQTISQPYIVASMTAALRLQATDRALEVGTGCGFQAAVLSHLAREVFTIELRPELASAASEKLARLSYHNVHVHCGDGTFGLPEFAPFDAILVAAAAPEVPEPLLTQLDEGGRMIIPVGGADNQELQLIEKQGGAFSTKVLEVAETSPAMKAVGPELSIVIPAYNEESRLPATLEQVAAYLKNCGREAEVLVVDDGSKDRTAAVAESFRDKISALRVVPNGVNRGKGFSVRHGVQEARGRIVLFTDADLSAPIEEADKLIEALEKYDVAIGSRAVDRSLITVHESPFREFAGIIFNKLVQIILWLPFVDTQCGFKAFRRERCGILFEQQTIERFGFDPELLYLARHHGLRAVEIPVRWGHSPATKVSMLRDSIQMFLDVFKIRWNSLLGGYPRHPGIGS
jgi:dolichyl-phosphate beta-glucosyltransferase